MAKGAEAKARVEDKIKEAFGADYIGLYDKKYYVWSEENGEPMQVSFSLTCPKVPVGEIRVRELDFSGSDGPAQVANKTSYEASEITQEEEDTIIALMKKLGL